MEVKEAKPTNLKKKKGFWKPEEDLILKKYVEIHGEGKWRTVSEKSGLRRGGRSCRLRWKNYLRPNIKRGEMSEDEKDLIIRLHKLLGNRWSLIAGRIPGRTDNEVKNYWNTHLHKVASVDERKQDKVESPEPHFPTSEEVSKTSKLKEEDTENINYDVDSLFLQDYEPVICDEETFSLTADNTRFPAFGSCNDEAMPFGDDGFQSFLLI